MVNQEINIGSLFSEKATLVAWKKIDPFLADDFNHSMHWQMSVRMQHI